jgi:hypothetical protein
MSLRNAVLIAFAASVVASITLAAVVRTYTVSVLGLHATVIWNEHHLVVFVPVARVGRSATVLQQIVPLQRWRGVQPFPHGSTGASSTTIIRFDEGVMQPPAQISRKSVHTLQGEASEPGTFDNAVLIAAGGIWSSEELKYLDKGDYSRILRAKLSDETYKWQSGALLGRPGTIELPVRLHGETVTLKGSRSTTRATIDLVDGTGTLTHVFDISLGERVVSARDFESALNGRQQAP